MTKINDLDKRITVLETQLAVANESGEDTTDLESKITKLQSNIYFLISFFLQFILDPGIL